MTASHTTGAAPGAAPVAERAVSPGAPPGSICISLDAMGGDHAPAEIVPAALQALRRHPELQLVLVGVESELRELLGRHSDFGGRLRLLHAADRVEMQDPPLLALRKKRDSSMRIALQLVRDGVAVACVSAGNTGALVALACRLLKTLPGIDRPAICASLPGPHSDTQILDLGANVAVSSAQLLQFALMGAELVSALRGESRPRVALLNIGTEETKGGDRLRQAAALLQDSNLNYVGFAEGDALYSSEVDVLVCDGFSGNVALKASEGVVRLLRAWAREAFYGSLYGRLAGAVAWPVLRQLRRRFDPDRYNGARLLGLRGIVIKSHGSANRRSFGHAIDEAVAEVARDIPARIRSRLERVPRAALPETAP